MIHSSANSSDTIDTFYVLDFDRCIGDTAKFHTVLETAVEAMTTVSMMAIREAKRGTEHSGGSFDTGRFVMAELAKIDSPVTWKEICVEMVRLAKREDMLEPHARDVLQLLDEKGANYGILTYGGEAWQRMKIEASQLTHIPYIITSVRSKGLILASWQLPDGRFALPAKLTKGKNLIARSLVLVDDKAVSFQDMPPGVRGLHVVWTDREVLPSQTGILPSGVSTAYGMTGVAELLFSQ